MNNNVATPKTNNRLIIKVEIWLKIYSPPERIKDKLELLPPIPPWVVVENIEFESKLLTPNVFLTTVPPMSPSRLLTPNVFWIGLPFWIDEVFPKIRWMIADS